MIFPNSPTLNILTYSKRFFHRLVSIKLLLFLLFIRLVFFCFFFFVVVVVGELRQRVDDEMK